MPFEGTLPLEDAMRDFELHVSGFDSYALYAPGMRSEPFLTCCMLDGSNSRRLSCARCLVCESLSSSTPACFSRGA